MTDDLENIKARQAERDVRHKNIHEESLSAGKLHGLLGHCEAAEAIHHEAEADLTLALSLLEQERERADQEVKRQGLLAEAIVRIHQSLGCGGIEAGMTGPEVLVLARDVAEAVERLRAETERLKAIEEERWSVVATRNAAIDRAGAAEAELAALREAAHRPNMSDEWLGNYVRALLTEQKGADE